MVPESPQLTTSSLLDRYTSRETSHCFKDIELETTWKECAFSYASEALCFIALEGMQFCSEDWKLVIRVLDFSTLRNLTLEHSNFSLVELEFLIDCVPELANPAGVLRVRAHNTDFSRSFENEVVHEQVAMLLKKVPWIRMSRLCSSTKYGNERVDPRNSNDDDKRDQGKIDSLQYDETTKNISVIRSTSRLLEQGAVAQNCDWRTSGVWAQYRSDLTSSLSINRATRARFKGRQCWFNDQMSHHLHVTQQFMPIDVHSKCLLAGPEQASSLACSIACEPHPQQDPESQLSLHATR